MASSGPPGAEAPTPATQVEANAAAPLATPPSASPPTRAVILEEVKQLEAAIAAVAAPGMAGVRADLQQQLAAKRKQLQDLKPLGQRLDGTRAALERATKRRLQAEEAQRLADAALQKALSEEETLKKDLQELEAAVGPDGMQETSLAALGVQMAAAVDQLKNLNDTVDENVIKDAQQECENLLSRFQATVKAAEVAAAQARAAAPRRLQGKQPAPDPPEPETRPTITNRLVGRQKVQSHLTSFFPFKKARSSLFPQVAAAPAPEAVTGATGFVAEVGPPRSAARSRQTTQPY